MKLNSKKDYRIIGGSGLLFFAALIWGTAFVAQSVGAESLDGFSFTAIRSLIGSIVLLPFVKIAKQKHFADGVLVEVQERARERTQENAQKRVRESTQESGQRIVSQYVGSSFLGLRRIEWIGGFFCGLALFAATNFQQFGIGMTTVGKAGFITALYVVIVPVMGLFFGKRPKPLVWGCVAAAVAGMYLLCLSEEGAAGLARGDLLVLICAFLFAIQILCVGYFAPRCNGIALSCIQFAVCGLLSLGPALVLEQPSIAAIRAAAIPLLYVGVMSSGVAYTIQIISQSILSQTPGGDTLASMIMCLESVISALAGWLILHQTMTPVELAGAGLMFAAVLTATVLG